MYKQPRGSQVISDFYFAFLLTGAAHEILSYSVPYTYEMALTLFSIILAASIS